MNKLHLCSFLCLLHPGVYVCITSPLSSSLFLPTCVQCWGSSCTGAQDMVAMAGNARAERTMGGGAAAFVLLSSFLTLSCEALFFWLLSHLQPRFPFPPDLPLFYTWSSPAAASISHLSHPNMCFFGITLYLFRCGKKKTTTLSTCRHITWVD